MSELGATMEAMAAHLQAALPSRQVTDSWLDISMRQSSELIAGVITVIFLGESDYPNYVGREAQFGTCDVLLIGQLEVSPIPKQDEGGRLVALAEFDMSEEIKEWTKGNLGGWPAGVSQMLLTGLRWSGQKEAPRGWVAATLQVQL